MLIKTNKTIETAFFINFLNEEFKNRANRIYILLRTDNKLVTFLAG